MPDFKATRAQLFLMAWLNEKPGRRIIADGQSPGFKLYELDEKDEDGKRPVRQVYPVYGSDSRGISRSDADRANVEMLKTLGGRDTIDTVKLHRNDLLSSMGHLYKPGYREAFVATLTNDPFYYRDNIVRLTRAGREWWLSEGKAAFEKLKASEDEDRLATERTILVAAPATISYKRTDEVKRAEAMNLVLPSMRRKVVRPYGTATVVKETATRIYVENVRRFENGADFDYRDAPIKGREPNLYVERSSIMADGVKLHQANRVAELDMEYADDIRSQIQEAIHKIIPILASADSRLIQKVEERSDMMRELLAEITSKPAEVLEDEKDEAEVSFRR